MRLSDYLDKTEITVAAFGTKIGVSAAAVSRYANNLRFPSREILERIRRATRGEVTANDFVHDLYPRQGRAA